MKLTLDGTFDVASSPEETFTFLVDPQRFAPMLPYFQELRTGEGPAFTVVLEVGVPQIRGRVEVETELVERAEPSRAVYRTSGRHSLGMLDTQLAFDIAPVEGGSRVAWASEGVVSGTLASLAQGLLLPLARRQIKALIPSVQAALGSLETQAEPEKSRGAVSSLKGLFARRKGATA